MHKRFVNVCIKAGLGYLSLYTFRHGDFVEPEYKSWIRNIDYVDMYMSNSYAL